MQLKEALGGKKFTVTFEIQASVDNEDNSSSSLIDNLEKVRGRMDGVSIVDIELEGVVGDSVKTCKTLKENRFHPIYQTSIRTKSRVKLQQDLFSAHNSGVENLLVFTEDYRLTGESLQENMFFHVDSGKLSSVLGHLKEGETFDGKTLNNPIDFVVGTGVEALWHKSVPKKGMNEMETMRNMGTGYFLTTPVFDLDQFQKFSKQIKTFGVPIIAEVMLLKNTSVARFINRHFKSGLVPDWITEKLDKSSNKKQASIDLFSDTVKGLKELCDGVHIITLGSVGDIKPYLDASKLT